MELFSSGGVIPGVHRVPFSFPGGGQVVLRLPGGQCPPGLIILVCLYSNSPDAHIAAGNKIHHISSLF